MNRHEIRKRNWDLLGEFADPVTRIITPEAARAFSAELRRRGWNKTETTDEVTK